MKKIISILLVIVMVLSLGTVAFATEGQETGRLGTQTAADRVQAYEKEVAVSRIMEIREKYFESNGVLSDEELSEIHALIAEVYPDADIEDYLPPLDAASRANPGDYQTLDLHLPGKVQETDYYCGPASGYAVLAGRGIYTTQSALAQKMHTTTNGTGFYDVNDALNQYNGQNGNRFRYNELVGYQLSGESMTATEWAIKFTNAAIATLLGNYGVIYNVHQVAGSSHFLEGYGNSNNVAASTLWHFVAGEGFDSSTPSRRICYYYDSNNQKNNLGDRHMRISFGSMAVLCNDRGLIY